MEVTGEISDGQFGGAFQAVGERSLLRYTRFKRRPCSRPVRQVRVFREHSVRRLVGEPATSGGSGGSEDQGEKQVEASARAGSRSQTGWWRR